MNLNTFVKGSCNDFCPPKESKMRTREKLLHFYELNPPKEFNLKTEHLPIKCFTRSTAGTEAPKSSDLRTFASLSQTVEYLLKYILLDKRKPFHYKYDFIFDRLRAIRQEIVLQNSDELETIKLIEPMDMFLSFSRYELCQSSIDNFDPKICSQHLQECLQKLLFCYDEVGQQYVAHLRNREFFECLYIIFNLGNTVVLNRAIRLRTTLNGKLFRKCLTMSIQFFSGKFYNAMRTLKLLPPILCGLAVLSLQKMPREIFLRFSSAYQSKSLTVPVEWLAKLLLYEDPQLLISDCKYYNIEVMNSCELKFNKLNFDLTKNVLFCNCYNNGKTAENDETCECVECVKYKFVHCNLDLKLGVSVLKTIDVLYK